MRPLAFARPAAQRLNAVLRHVPVGAVWLAGLLPLALLVWDTVAANLGVEPIREIEHRLGLTALYFLIGGLAVTPVLRLFGLNLIRYRRAIGLLAFAYLCLHMLAWAVMDMGLLWGQMARDVVKRPYLLFGMAAFLALLPLALTSNDLSIRKMGGQAWRRLHRLVYPAAVLACVHYLWVGKVITLAPALWLAVVLGLLIIRPILS